MNNYFSLISKGINDILEDDNSIKENTIYSYKETNLLKLVNEIITNTKIIELYDKDCTDYDTVINEMEQMSDSSQEDVYKYLILGKALYVKYIDEMQKENFRVALKSRNDAIKNLRNINSDNGSADINEYATKYLKLLDFMFVYHNIEHYRKYQNTVTVHDEVLDFSNHEGIIAATFLLKMVSGPRADVNKNGNLYNSYSYNYIDIVRFSSISSIRRVLSGMASGNHNFSKALHANCYEPTVMVDIFEIKRLMNNDMYYESLQRFKDFKNNQLEHLNSKIKDSAPDKLQKYFDIRSNYFVENVGSLLEICYNKINNLYMKYKNEVKEKSDDNSMNSDYKKVKRIEEN